ncbi:hypothetical protein D3C73_1168580 [compost metagenome]
MLQLLELRQNQYDADSDDQDEYCDGNTGRERPLPALAGNLKQCPYCEDWRLDQQLQTDNNQHLHLGNIIGRTGNQTCCREAVNLLHGEGLHLIEQLGAQPGREVGRYLGCNAGNNNRGRQTAERTQQHPAAGSDDLAHVTSLCLNQPGNFAHIIGQFQIEPHLGNDK